MENPKKHKKWLLFVIVLFTVFLGSVLLRVGISIYTEKDSELESAASRLGVEPSLEGIGEYIEGAISLGMSRDSVREILSAITPVVSYYTRDSESVELESTELIVIYFYESSRHPGYWLVLEAKYNDEEELISIHNGSTELFLD